MLRGLTVAAGAALLALAGGAGARPGGGTPTAFVSAERASLLVGVRLDTGRVVARVRVPAGPHNVASYRKRYVLVTSPPAGAVTFVDAYTRRVVRTWRGFGYPHDVEVEGDRAYVTEEGGGRLAVIDLRRGRIVRRIAVGARPHDVAVGDVALVTHGPSTGALTVVDLGRPGSGRAELRRLRVGGPPHDVSEQPDSATAYLTYWGSGWAAAVDWGRGRLRWRRPVGALIHHVQFDYYHGRRLWATDHRTGEVLLLGSGNGRVLRRLRGCPGAHHVLPVGQAWVAVACHDADALAVWSQRTWERRLIRAGDGPHGVAEVVLP